MTSLSLTQQICVEFPVGAVYTSGSQEWKVA